jgi:hypothetical protein
VGRQGQEVVHAARSCSLKQMPALPAVCGLVHCNACSGALVHVHLVARRVPMADTRGAACCRAALEARDYQQLFNIMNRNFDLRR